MEVYQYPTFHAIDNSILLFCMRSIVHLSSLLKLFLDLLRKKTVSYHYNISCTFYHCKYQDNPVLQKTSLESLAVTTENDPPTLTLGIVKLCVICMHC